MSTVAVDVIPVRKREKPKSIFEVLNLKAKVDNYKFNKVWADRNLDNGELIVDALEIDPIILDQYMFIQEDKQLLVKLERIGFTKLDKYNDSKLFDKFCYVMYNDKYNVAISLYNSAIKDVITTAEKIAKDTEFGYDYNLTVFLSAVKVLNK